MSTARWRCSPPPPRAASAASSTSPRSPRASPSCRSTARRRRKAEELVEHRASTGRSSARRRFTAPATARRSNCSRWRKRGQICCRPRGRLSLIHVDDLAALLLALAAPDAPNGLVVEPDDGRQGGWTHREFGDALGERGRQSGRAPSPRRVFCSRSPPASTACSAATGQADPRPRRLFLPSRLGREPGPGHPTRSSGARKSTPAGLGDTAEWYRAQGWL